MKQVPFFYSFSQLLNVISSWFLKIFVVAPLFPSGASSDIQNLMCIKVLNRTTTKYVVGVTQWQFFASASFSGLIRNLYLVSVVYLWKRKTFGTVPNLNILLALWKLLNLIATFCASSTTSLGESDLCPRNRRRCLWRKKSWLGRKGSGWQPATTASKTVEI